VKRRKQFGQQLYHFQSIKNKLADMEVKIRAAELLIRQAAELKDAGENVTKAASVAKLFASEASMDITKDAVQIFGAYGYSQEYPLERFFRDAKITEIGDGTSEIQRIIIADELLKGKH
jgi:alkylation response protein AidB-like acyl-CoA dehydrogenase